MRILITGASGHLGRRLCSVLRAHGHTAIGTFHTRAFPGLTRTDLTDAAACRALVGGGGFDAVVHSAAIRDPNECALDRDRARRVNVESTQNLLRALSGKAVFVFISSDYVFDGTDPPYAEEDATAPVNFYGETKVESERRVRDATRRHVICRVPVLYGLNDAEETNFFTNAVRLVRAGQPTAVEDWAVRYPTHIQDVAEAVAFLLQTGFQGTVHLTADEKTTKYGFAGAVANALGVDAGHLAADPSPPSGPAPRPRDCHLSMAKFQGLGGFAFRGFSEVLPDLVKELG